MKRSYKFRLYPNKEQVQVLDNQLELCRLLYNKMLKQRIDIYKRKKVSLNYYHQSKQLPLIKENKSEYKELHSQVLQKVLKTLDLAFQGFFRRLKKGEKPGFPRFKGKNRIHSLCYPQGGFLIKDRKVKLSKIGNIRIKKHRKIEGKIKTCTLRKTLTEKWYICFSVEIPDIVKKRAKTKKKVVGIDLGINKYAVLSDSTEVKTEKYYKEYKKKLARVQSNKNRKGKRTKNRKKALKRERLVHEKIANSRKDHLHKQSRKLVETYDIIVHEKLKIKNMSRSAKGTKDNPGKNVRQKAGLNRSIADMSWGLFLNQLKYKAEEAGKEVVGVNPRYTSQKCSHCGNMVKKSLSVRTHICSCGTRLDRDLNASINILNKYLSTAGHAGINACGVMSSR